MKTLMRAGAVLAALALAAPALACSEMQQTSAEKKVEQQPTVAKAQKPQAAKRAAPAPTAVAKAQAPKAAAN